MVFRFFAALLFVLSAAQAEMECSVERDGDAVVVRSPIAQGNFLFRLPGAFSEVEAPEGFLVQLQARRDGGEARVALRIIKQGIGDARQRLTDLAPAYVGKGLSKANAPVVTGGGARVTAETAGAEGKRTLARTLLLVRDGTLLYLLYVDRTPADAFPDLPKAAAAFTILDPKGVEVVEAPVDPKALEPKTLENDFYRLKLYKPAGFLEMTPDADSDKGIVYHLRRQDELKNACEIRIRVFLSKTLKIALDKKAMNRMNAFAKRHSKVKVPRTPRKTRWPAAKFAYKAKLVGRTKKGHVVTEEWRFIEHENGRTYEIQMTLYGAAAREWRKDISAFWRKLKIANR